MQPVRSRSVTVSNRPDTNRSEPKPDERLLPHSMNAYSVNPRDIDRLGE